MPLLWKDFLAGYQPQTATEEERKLVDAIGKELSGLPAFFDVLDAAYAKDDKVVCFFQSAKRFKARYATFGFSDQAKLDEGAMWPTSFALKSLTATEEKKITALVKKAVR